MGCTSQTDSGNGTINNADSDKNSESGQIAHGGRLVLSATKPGVRLDPHMDAQWEVLYILSAVYDTLLDQSADGQLIAGLAHEWDVDESGKTYTFHLLEDVEFHDGTRFDAEAVKFNFERILSLGPQSLKAGNVLPKFSAIKVIDDFTITFDLIGPDSDFLFWLSMPYLAMISPTAAQTWGDEYHHHQSGTGPFMFAEYIVGDHYTLKRNPAYAWGPSSKSHEGPAYLQEIVWRFLPEPATRAPALEAGDVDVAFDLLPTDAEYIKGSKDFDISEARLSGQPAFWFLNTALPPTDDINVRKAILYGSDMKSAVTAITRGFSPVAHGPLSAVTPEYASEIESHYQYDPELARNLLSEAGWLDADGDGIRKKNGRDLVIRMSMVSWGKSPAFSELLYSQLRSIGIDLRLEMMDYSAQMMFGREGTKNMLFMGGSGHSASDSLRSFFHSANADSGFAWSKYRNTELDALLEDAPLTVDPEERAELYRRAQILIMDQALILPIYDYVLLIGIDKTVKGLQWGSTGLIPTYHDIYVEDAGTGH